MSIDDTTKDSEDKVFEDCNRLANMFETNMLCALDVYTTMEQKYKDKSYEYIIMKTSQHMKKDFKERVEKDKYSCNEF